MPRPSLKEERTEEILNAFMRCVARYGLDGSTLERISEEANVGRPLLRHYLGNREEMVDALLSHVMDKFDRMTADLVAGLPPENRLPALIDILFSSYAHEAENAPVYQALIASSDRFPGMSKKLFKFIRDFETAIAREILREHPSADIQKCQAVAAGIAAIYFSFDGALPLSPPTSWREKQRTAVQILLDSLK